MQNLCRLQNFKWLIPAFMTALATWALPFVNFPFDADFIKNPDASVRLERIKQLIDGQAWYDLSLLRISTPDGQVLHWTRPLDILVGIGAWPLSTVMPSHEAVLVAAIGLSLCSVLLSVFLVYWIMVNCFRVQPWAGGLAALSFITMADMVSIFAPSSGPDHHALLLLLFLTSFGICMNGAIGKGRGYGLGVVFAIALWVSPESFMALTALYGGLVALWIKGGQETRLSEFGIRSAVSLILTILFALLIEFGTLWPNMALDRLSGFTVLSSVLILAFWAVLRWCPQSFLGSWIRRLLWVVLFAILAFAIIFKSVPHIMGGPMANANPWFINVWGNVFGDGFRLSVWDGRAIICAALAVLWGFKRHPYSYVVTPILVVSLILSKIDSTRWIIYGETVAWFVLVYAYSTLWPKLKDLGDGAKGVFMRAVSVTTMCVLPMMLGIMARTSSDELPRPSIAGEGAEITACNVEDILPTLKAFPKTRILAHPNITPTLLFSTKHDVMAVPIHPNGPAVHDSVRVLTAINDKKAFDIIMQYDVGLVVFCPSGDEQIFYGRDKNGLYARTLRDHGPDWLLPLGAKQSGYKVYAVKK